ncbi:MAG: (2Fe-2S)-binding protein [Tissierella sp.]
MTIICYCSNVSEEEIIDAINNGARNLPDIKRMTGACTIGNCKEFHPKGT